MCFIAKKKERSDVLNSRGNRKKMAVTEKGGSHQHDDLGGLSLGANKDHLMLALEATSDGVWVWHIPSGEAYFSPRYYAMLGYAPDAFPANYDSWASLLHPDDLKKTQATIQNHIQDKSESYEVEFRLKAKSGKWLWTLGRGSVVEWDEIGHPICIAGSHVNIDKRKRAEHKLSEYQDALEQRVRERTIALEQTTSLLEATFDAIPDILGVQDHRHRIIRYNAAGYRYFNMTSEDVSGKRCFELIGRDRECELCATSECYRTKKPASVERYEESLDAWLDVRAYPILDEQGNLVKVIEHLRDITPAKKAEAENRKLHEQLLHAQRMEAVGTLAGGVAHDFNNLLMGIQGRISLMSMDMNPSESAAEHIQAIETYIRNATNLTRQLLGFARGGKYEVKPMDINKLVRDSANMFGRTKKELVIRVITSEGPLIVEADQRQIENVLLNLYINAWQAMAVGGQLCLTTDQVALDELYCKPHKVIPGQYAKITVTDNGSGMDEETLKQIFDPFFTTKEKGRGTGLGLASAYGIISNHAGFFTVYSQVGQGSTFHIYLPISEKNAGGDHSRIEGLVAGSETILLVDDEQMIIDVGQALLKRLGYEVIALKGGEAAIELVQRKGVEIDLVILDMVMPGLDGGETFDRIHAIDPDLPVMLSSGYTFTGRAEAILSRGCVGFIQKPFTVFDLSEKIRQVLGKEKRSD